MGLLGLFSLLQAMKEDLPLADSTAWGWPYKQGHSRMEYGSKKAKVLACWWLPWQQRGCHPRLGGARYPKAPVGGDVSMVGTLLQYLI